MKQLLTARALLHDDGQLEVEVTPASFDERQTRELANGLADLIMKALGEKMDEDFRTLHPARLTTH